MEIIEKKKNMGGRPTHEGWQLYHFEKVEGDKGKSVAKCQKCQNIIKNTTITRLLAHRKKCGSLPSFTASSSVTSPQQHPPMVQIPTTTTTATILSPQPSKIPQHLISKIEVEDFRTESIQDESQTQIVWTHDGNFNDETENQSSMDIINEDILRHRKSSDAVKRKFDTKSIDVALSSFLIGCNLTFDVVDSKHFKNFVSALNSDYKIPTSSQLTAKVLSQLKGGDSSEKSRGRKRQYYSSDSD